METRHVGTSSVGLRTESNLRAAEGKPSEGGASTGWTSGCCLRPIYVVLITDRAGPPHGANAVFGVLPLD